jgi:hypothetical protein
MNRSKLEQMKAQIDSLEAADHKQLYDIISQFTQNFTKTSNGVFVSSENLSQECLEQIEKHIQFCSDQHKRMEDDLKQRKSYERLIE